MGTSTSLPTPSGGKWTPVKNAISDYLDNNAAVTPSTLIGGTIRAAGLAARTPISSGSGAGGTAAATTGRGTGGGRHGGGRSGGRGSVGRTVAGLGAFGAAVRDAGMTAALGGLGLGELRGRPAAEVVSRIAEHLVGDTTGLQGELLTAALRDALLDAAALAGDPSYENLEAAFQTFLEREGVEGLVELFLTHYVFSRVWTLIESHVERRSESASDATAMASAVKGACRAHVRELVEDSVTQGQLERVNWFGREGLRLANTVVGNLEARLSAL